MLATWLSVMLLAELGRESMQCPLAAGGESCAVCIRQSGCASTVPQFTHLPLAPPADGSLDVALRPGRVDWSTIVADLSIPSPGLCRGLFEIYLGSESGACSGCVCLTGCGMASCKVGQSCCWLLHDAKGCAATGWVAKGLCAGSSPTPPAPSALPCPAVLPDARKEWAAGARKLLESDDIRRQTRKGGSG